MAWIEAHQELARHPKVRRLARELDTTRAEAIGVLLMVWWWALDYASDGTIHDPEDLAEATHRHDGDQLTRALVSTGWLDPIIDDGDLAGWQIHDWDDYAGKTVAAREARRIDGEYGNHVRWHKKAPKADCPWCSGGDIGGRSGGESHITEQDIQDITAAATQSGGESGGDREATDFDKALLQVANERADEIAATKPVPNRAGLLLKLMASEDIHHEARKRLPPTQLPEALTDTVRTLDDPPY